MAEKPQHLNYGQFGGVHYDYKKNKWTAKRSLKQPSAIRRIGLQTEHIPGIPQESHNPRPQGVFSVARQKAVRRLSSAYPETDPSSRHLLEYLNDVSTVASKAHLGPIAGELVAHGTARGHDYSSGGRRDIIHNIVAVAGGELGNGIRLLEMRPSRQGWESDKSIWINTFELQLREAAWWDSGSEQVRQVCFAQKVDHDTSLLAVQTSACITILRPLFVTNPQSGSRSNCENRRSVSRIDPNPLITLRLPTDSDTQFADVAFNLSYQQQLAAVDTSGKFAIWTLSGRHVADEYTLHGELADSVLDTDQFSQRGKPDGWHKIIWIGSASTFLVSSRVQIQAFEVRGLMVNESGIIDLELDTGQMILDIKNDPASLRDFYVVSTSHLYWMRWKSGQSSRRSSDAPASFGTISAWKHHRDTADITLYISFLPNTDGKKAFMTGLEILADH